MVTPDVVHLVIDLETLSTDKVAPVIREFGISQINFYFASAVPVFLASGYLELQKQFNDFRLVDGDTVKWLEEKQGVTMHDLLNNPKHLQGCSISDMLDEINAAYTNCDAQAVWSFGSTFDIEILNNCYKRAGRKAPWHYRDERCERTLEALFPTYAQELQQSRITHEAATDSYDQAKRIANVLQRLIEAKLPINLKSMANYTYG